LAGRDREAAAEAELADEVSQGNDAWDRGAVAVWLRRTGSARPRRRRPPVRTGCKFEGDAYRAAEARRQLGCPYDAAMALIDSTEEAALGDALRGFTTLGAHAAARVAQQRLRLFPAHPAPTASTLD
jgi:hypothetical protein